MHDRLWHVFTDEFDDLSIAVSIDIDDASPSMRVTISEPNCVSDEFLSMTVARLDHTRTLDERD